MKLPEAVKLGCLIAVTIFACIVLWQVNVTIADARNPLLETLRGMHAAANETALTMHNTRDISTAEKKQFDAQAKAAADSQAKLNADLQKFGDLIDQTDRSVNGVLVPQLTATLKSTQDLSAAAGADLQRTTDLLAPSLENFAKASASAADALADPHIKETTAHLDDVAANLASTTQHVDGIAAEGQKTADYYYKKLTTPAGFAKTMFSFILNTAYKVREGFFP